MAENTLISNGVKYPVTLNFYSIKMWELAKGKKMSEIMSGLKDSPTESDSIIQMAELCYYGVKEECEEKGVEFGLTEKQFVRGLDGGQMQAVMQIATSFLNPPIEGSENNRQPQPTKLKKSA